MPSRYDRFDLLPVNHRREVHLNLCTKALDVWLTYCDASDSLVYNESVCGTTQTVDRALPGAALLSVIANEDLDGVAARYLEPLTAIQEDDFSLPREVEFAYLAIHNLYARYVLGKPIDDWLIVNQSLTALGQEADVVAVLDAIVARLTD